MLHITLLCYEKIIFGKLEARRHTAKTGLPRTSSDSLQKIKSVYLCKKMNLRVPYVVNVTDASRHKRSKTSQLQDPRSCSTGLRMS